MLKLCLRSDKISKKQNTKLIDEDDSHFLKAKINK